MSISSNLESVEGFNLPEVIRNELKRRGIKYFTPPQAKALKLGLLDGENIIVSSPTASGKTLIAEMALVRAFLSGGKGIYATPLKTLANEKYEEFSLWERYGIRVGISTGDYDEPGEWLGKHDIVVATYERLDSLFRLRPSWLSKVQTIVIDEFHNIGDEHRGPVVELLTVHTLNLGAQLVGLSATIGNPEELAEWVGAKLVISDWRPVKLVEGFYSRRRKAIVFSDGRVEKLIASNIVDHVVKHALKGNYQVIIFQQARHKAEYLASRIVKLMPQLSSDLMADISRQLKELELPSSEVSSLKPLINHGVAFHHAGLSHGSRLLVEKLFRDGLIRVVVATPTLAAGINMPARRVLIYTRRFEEGYLKPISIAEYKQMAGRAGRPQYDPYGEAVIADVKSDEEGWRYVKGKPENVVSALINERAMRIHVLALISSGYVDNLGTLYSFIKKTLAHKQLLESGVSSADYVIDTVVKSLVNMGMIDICGAKLRATKLGSMVSRLYVDPLTAVMILDGLRDTEPDLPPIYYVTLIAMTPDFNRVRVTKFRELAEEARAAYSSGIIPPPLGGVDYYEWLRAYKIGLIINYWINEVSDDDIISKLGIGAGDLYSIVETCSWLVYAASKICEVTGLYGHAKALEKISLRVRHGVKEELLELVRIKGIGRVRARILYNAGIKSLEDLLRYHPEKLEKLPTFGRALAKKVISEARKLLGRAND